jgi:hypothetical protein
VLGVAGHRGRGRRRALRLPPRARPGGRVRRAHAR